MCFRLLVKRNFRIFPTLFLCYRRRYLHRICPLNFNFRKQLDQVCFKSDLRRTREPLAGLRPGVPGCEEGGEEHSGPAICWPAREVEHEREAEAEEGHVHLLEESSQRLMVILPRDAKSHYF